MAEINKVVKELWQKTYRNRDIDCIQIKADADGAKSYAYRVVMQAGGAELEMRGRCSAGQKVCFPSCCLPDHVFWEVLEEIIARHSRGNAPAMFAFYFKNLGIRQRGVYS